MGERVKTQFKFVTEITNQKMMKPILKLAQLETRIPNSIETIAIKDTWSTNWYYAGELGLFFWRLLRYHKKPTVPASR
jgi:hypothetical protein